jgi:hypothetical protein
MEYILALSLILNAALLFLYLKETNQKKSRKDTREAEELLADILQGDALVRITRISPADVFLRSPGGR